LAARLRRADIHAAAGAVEETARIVAQIRARWPGVCIVLRADSGFAREALMKWCELNGVDFARGVEILTEPHSPAWQPGRTVAEFRDSKGNRMVIGSR
jgi:hypothetical protein